MTWAEMLKSLTPDQQAFLNQMLQPQNPPSLGMGQYLPPQPGIPPNVSQYMASAPSISDSGQTGPGAWPYPYAGRSREMAIQHSPDIPQRDEEMFSQAFNALQRQQNNTPRSEQGVTPIWPSPVQTQGYETPDWAPTLQSLLQMTRQPTFQDLLRQMVR